MVQRSGGCRAAVRSALILWVAGCLGCSSDTPPSPAPPPSQTNSPASQPTSHSLEAVANNANSQPVAPYPAPGGSLPANQKSLITHDSTGRGEASFPAPSFPTPSFDPTTTDPALKGRPLDPSAPLADLMKQAQQQGLLDGKGNLVVPPAREINADQVARAGIQEIRGEHIRIYTDLPLDDALRRLPAVFDAAYPQWCEYFGVPKICNPPWRTNAFIMKDRERFKAAGLLPDTVPEFDNGYALGHELFVLEQPTEYYRRHLLLHEGTHSFMLSRVPGPYPAWYFEGLAELFGTHLLQVDSNGLKVNTRYMPSHREEVPYWGRTKLVGDAFRESRARHLASVMSMNPGYSLSKEEYAWAWAVCAFFDGHPRYRDRFRTLFQLPRDADFAAEVDRRFANDLEDLATEWQVFVAALDYGYDVERAAVQFAPGEPLPAEGKLVRIASDRGWQSSGVRLEQGQAYDIAAVGRFKVASGSSDWMSEPGGVTIQYHDGLPLGMLVGALLPDDRGGRTPLITPDPIGLQARFEPQVSGTLYLKINEAAAGLADNSGIVQVRIRATDRIAEGGD